ncbi:unnamed protein product [Cylindrotheca closterium]|uniref:Helicase-associated domain-containing protein n=1 Tax=Cylindrotheca closterium TaxID=2856 RepID=A0AAD2G1T4_9STRA|nr:unnamed protein product [Cylindrotheca closterium]
MEARRLHEAAAREAAREALLREAAFREARAAEAASALSASSHHHHDPSLAGGLPPSYHHHHHHHLLGGGGGGGGFSSLDYAALGYPSYYGSAALPLHLRGGPGASVRTAAAAAAASRPPLSAAALRAEALASREHALRSIAHEEAVLAATREQARRNLAHEEAIITASREHAIRNLAHEEAILAATREQARRNLAHEEALLAATREQARRNGLSLSQTTNHASGGSNGTAAASAITLDATNPTNLPRSWGVEAMPLSSTREFSRREIVHDCVEEEGIYKGKKLRSGKFSDQEEAYGDILIELFEKGQVDIERGVSLRTFLAKALHCSPMRVTKKIAGKGNEARKNYLGRKNLPVLGNEFRHLNARFQTARDNFLQVLKEEWEMEDSENKDSSEDDEESINANQPLEGIQDKAWNKRVGQLADFYREYGVANLPIQKKYRELRDFVSQVRIQYRKKQLSKERIAQLDDLGFIWSFRRFVPWGTRLEELRAFRERHGHSRVPFRYKENPSFGLWAANMRARYSRYVKGKDSTVAPIAPEQIEALNEIGFVWELSNSVGRSPNYQQLQQQQQLQQKLQQQLQPPPPPTPTPHEILSTAQQQTQFFMGKVALNKAVRLNSSYWDGLYSKVEANLLALDRLYKQEEAAAILAGEDVAYVVNPDRAEAPTSSSQHDDDDDDSSSSDGDTQEEADDENSSTEEDEDASMGDWSDGEILDDDEYRKVEASLRALDQWYKEEAELEATGKLAAAGGGREREKSPEPEPEQQENASIFDDAEDEIYADAEEEEEKVPAKARVDDSSDEGKWL